MALLTQDKIYDNVRQPTLGVYTLANTTNFLAGSFVAYNLSTQRLVPHTGAAGQILLGRLYDADNGNNTFLGVGDDTQTVYGGPGGKPQGRVILSEEILPAVSITGLTGSTQVGQPVYLNQDDQTFTLTAPSPAAGFGVTQIGEVFDFVSSGVGDLLVYSYWVRAALQKSISASGGGGEWVHALTLVGSAANALSAAAATGIGLAIPAPFHGTIVDCFAFVTGTLTGGNLALAPGITPNGGAFATVTGGVITFAGGDAAKARKQGTSITGANEFHIGDTIDLATTSFTSAPTAGAFDVWIKLQPKSGT